MKTRLILLALSLAFAGCGTKQQMPLASGDIKSFSIDFNWGDGGPNAFAGAGLWADADPAEHVKWYEDLGCNIIQTFAVSCNGYAWYKGGKIPEQPGLKHDFLPEMVKLGHAKGMQVYGYFCAGSNTRWGTENPDLSYGIPSSPHIPYTTQYLDFLCESIQEALRISKIDGLMIDWMWNPEATPEPYPALRWIDCEKQMWAELMGEEFPGVENLTDEGVKDFRRKALARCWDRIYKAVKSEGEHYKIWLTCSEIDNPDLAGSAIFSQADILMNEKGEVDMLEKIRSLIGPQTQLLTCLAQWNAQDPAKIIPEAQKADIGLYGFTKPGANSLPPPIASFLEKPVDDFTGDSRNIAFFARVYNGLSADYIAK